MRLRWKTLSIIVIVFISVLVTSLAILPPLIMNSVATIEQEESFHETGRIFDALSSDLAEMNATTFDYAAWDATYEFVQDGNTKYITENMIDGTFINLRLNVMLFLNTSGQVVFGKAFDLQNMTEVPLPQGLLDYLVDNDLLLLHETTTSTIAGVVLISEGPMLVASSPIITSQDQGPIRGTLITGRFLDSLEISHLYDLIRLPMVMQVLGNSWVSSDFQAVYSSLSEDKPLFSKPLDTETVAGYALIDDIYGKPVLIMRITMPRNLYAQGLASVIYSVFALISIGTVFGVVTIVLLEKFVLSRLSRLSIDVQNIGKSGDFTARVPVTGKDELSDLGDDINSMLSRLEQTTKKLEMLLETAREGIVTVDPDENITFVNKAFADMVGYGQDELVGLNVRRLLDEEGNRKITEETETRKKGETSRYELVLYRKDGEPRITQLSASPLWNEDRNYTGSLGIVMDITEHKLMEEQLRASEEKYRGIAERSFDAIFTMDLEGRFTYVSPSVEKMVEFQQEEIVGKPFQYFLAESRMADAAQAFTRIMKGETVKGLRVDIPRKDGTFAYFEINVSPITVKGEIVGIQGIARDITERKRIEETLLESQQKFERLFNSNPEAAAFVDVNDCVLEINPRFAELFGYSPEEAKGKALDNLIVPEVKREEAEALTKESMSGYIHRETIRKTKSGLLVPVLISAAPITIEGRLTGNVVSYRDITERRKMEEQLRESEERLRQFIEYAPDAIYINSLNGVFTDGNKQAEILTGYKKEELVGKNMAEVGLLSEDYLPKATEMLQKNMNGQKTGPDEFELTKKDGCRIWVEISTIPLKRSGQVEVLGIARDITERKKAEQALRDSEAKYRLLFENVNDVVFSYDSGFRVLSVSPSVEKALGYKPEELVGRSIQELKLMTPESTEAAVSNAARALSGEIVGTVVYEFVKKDGTRGFGEVSGSPLIRDGKVAGVIVVARDVTERKRIEDALRESEEKIRNILQSSPDAIAVTDLNGTMIDCNQAALELAGVSSKEELLGKNTFDLISPRDYEKSMKSMEILLERGTIRDFEFTLIAEDGREFPAEVSMSLMRDSTGEPKYLVATIKDITERKQMQRKLEEYSQHLEEMVEKRTEQLKEAQEQLVKAERLAAIGQVAAMVGHDLRNPLTGIKGAAYYLKTRHASKTDKKTMEMLELIEKDVEYSNKIITDLLEYSRDMHLEPTETTPKSIVSETLSLLEVPKNIELINLTQDEPRIKIDIEKLNRVFVNLVKNAFDAMPYGGKLTIKSTRTDGNVEFAFTDTGMGMTKDQMGKLWTPFFTTKAKGMGLGLPICKRIVEAHKGQISVESMAGLGTTFKVTVPIEPKPTEGGEKVWVNVPESLLSTTTKA